MIADNGSAQKLCTNIEAVILVCDSFLRKLFTDWAQGYSYRSAEEASKDWAVLHRSIGRT